MENSGIGWKIYADSTLNLNVSGKAYVRATRGPLQVTIASNAIMTSMVSTFVIAPFISGVELSDIHDRETTAPYWEVPQMPVSIATTDKYVSMSKIWKEQSRLRLKEAARFCNNLHVGINLTDAVPSPQLQKKSEIRWHLPPQTHIAPQLPPHPFQKIWKIAKSYILFVILTGNWLVSPQILSFSTCWWEAWRPLVG